MYRSYSVNNMPQPIRHYGEPRPGGAAPDERECPPAAENGGKGAAAENVHKSNEADACKREGCSEQSRMLQCQCAQCPLRQQGTSGGTKGGILANLKSDDVILLAVALVLLMDGCEDKLLIAAIGLVFFSDYLGL